VKSKLKVGRRSWHNDAATSGNGKSILDFGKERHQRSVIDYSLGCSFHPSFISFPPRDHVRHFPQPVRHASNANQLKDTVMLTSDNNRISLM
jgi:hypothetical protein